MKYAVIHPRLGATHVAGAFRWAWLANLFADIYQARNTAIDGVDVVQVTTNIQDIVNICEQRDQALADRHSAVSELWQMVARNEEGKWTTVHEADTELGDEAAALLDRLLA